MSRVSDWLSQLNLGEYAAAFARNDIVWEILPDLDHETLKEIGIESIGHRLLIIKAAAELVPESDDQSGKSPAAESAGVIASPTIEDAQAERRQLTLVFCDLVGSTELASRLDPEDWREIVRAYQDFAAKHVDCFDGYIAQYLGDGLLIYYGYPSAHEDDARRAVLTGLGICESIGDLNQRLMDEFQTSLSVRIGIHTGPVVIGEVGGGNRFENLAMGESPNYAARLQAVALPGQLVVSDTTHRIVRDEFTFDDLGLHSLKGIAEPARVWAVVGAAPTDDNVETDFKF